MDEAMKRLATPKDGVVQVIDPVPALEYLERRAHYLYDPPMTFAKRFIDSWYRPTEIIYNDQSHKIQMNFCANPLCRWFGEEQLTFATAKYRPSRYKLVNDINDKAIKCNPDPLNTSSVPVLSHHSQVYSNWAIAEEIARLVTHRTVVSRTPKYTFHKPDCPFHGNTFFDAPHCFYKWGENKAKSQRYKCRTCSKVTNIEPVRGRRTNYDQNKNEVLIRIAGHILGRSPVKKTIKALGIGVKTYYHKLEWIYRCCLEFLEKHENQALLEKEFTQLRLTSDSLTYHLNHIRKKEGRFKDADKEDPNMVTQIITTCDAKSRYVFRADVNYDWDVKISDVARHTWRYKDDHLHNFNRRYERLRDVKYYPLRPTPYDTQTTDQWEKEVKQTWQYESYIPGLHTHETYTALAHFWLVRRMLNVKQWVLISDSSWSLMTAISRVFAKEINEGYAHQFIYKIDRDKKREAAQREYSEALHSISQWAKDNGLQYSDNKVLRFALGIMTDDLKRNPLYTMETLSNGGKWPKKARYVRHPVATPDQGYKEVSCVTFIADKKEKEIASLLLGVDGRATDEFFQLIRRSINIIERPLLGARNESKSYIYSNLNPRYAHYAVTILRTVYNFCTPWHKASQNNKLTPAQRLGIARKAYTLEDILYQHY